MVCMVSSREFNRDVGRAKRAAKDGPVVITDRGRPAYVLMNHDEYLRITGPRKSLVDLLRQDDPEADFDFEFPKLSNNMGFKIPDFEN